jgi:diguanylate cyclase (GGDEF)-like protein/hemerythrin-like metal-binding protein/PAS domain S-box-containing protein
MRTNQKKRREGMARSVDIVPWNDHFATGISVIDEQHKRLVQILNLLASHTAFNSELPNLDTIFGDLIGYTDYHFQTEERMWNEYLPQDELESAHREMHASFISQIFALKEQRHSKSDDQVIEEILTFLTGWLASHILENDRYLAKIVLAMQSGMSSEEAKALAKTDMGGSSRVLLDIILSIYGSISTNTLHLMRELTAQKRHEAAIKSNQRLILSMLENSPIAARIATQDGRKVAYANKRYARLINSTVEHVTGADPRNYYADPREYEDILAELARGHTITDRLIKLAIPEQGTVWVLATYLSINYEERPAILGWFYDVTRLREAASQLQMLASNISDVISRHDLNGTYLFVTGACQALQGLDASELLGHSCYEFFHPDDNAAIRDIHRKVVAHPDTTYSARYRLLRKDGSYVWVESTFRSTLNTDKAELELISVTRDITERKRTEAETLESESRFRQMFEGHSASMLLIEPETGSIVEANAAASRFYGYTLDQLRTMKIQQINTQPADVIAKERMQALKEDRNYFIFEHRLANGSLRVVEVHSSPVTYRKSQLLFSIIHDITDRHHAEQALRNESEKNRALLHNASDGIHILDTEGNIVEVSDSFCSMLGYTRNEMIGMNLRHWDAGFDEIERTRVFKQQFRQFKRTQFETRHRRKDGSVFDVEVSGFPLMLQGKPVVFNSSRDITDRKQVELALKLSEQRLRTIIDTEPECVKVLDRRGRVLQMNAVGLTMLEADSLEEVQRHTLLDYVFPEDRAAFLTLQRRVMKGERGILEFRIRGLKGTARHLETHATPMRDENGEIVASLGITRDVTEKIINAQQQRIAATAFESQEGMLVTDASGAILRVNQSFTRITGYSSEEVIGKNPRILSSGRHDVHYYRAMWDGIKKAGVWEGEIWNRRKNGDVYPEHLTITAVKDPDGTVTNYVATLVDITKSKASADEIKRLAFYDPLTLLPNRRLLLDRLHLAIVSNSRTGSEGALLFIDLDNFKNLNDTLGHHIGDKLLQQVAERLTNCVREGDTVARLGGDEFVVMLENLSKKDLDAAAQTKSIATKIMESLNQPYLLADRQYRNSPSIGITLITGREKGTDELLRQADIAMYQSKKAGRNTIRFFDPKMQESINARVDMERDLRIALEEEQLRLHYQVQVDSLNHPIGVEALIRWTHPLRGMVSPAEFIPLAEESGLILTLGNWILDTACAQLKAWQKDVLTCNLLLSINVSARQFHQAEFVKQVKHAVRKYGINPAMLKLELTESMLLADIEDTIAVMSELQKIGIQFSLDDFGTGFSSLQYLKRLPIYQLKIDQSFVRDIASDNNDKTIVQTIIVMAHTLNIDVIAEGVETDEQRNILLASGCGYYQGYLFSKPLPVAEFERILRSCKVQ